MPKLPIFRPGRTWTAIVLDSLLVFLLTAALIKPLFKVKYEDRWASIESTFIADARFLNQHWPHPLWQPLWYGGTRFDYVYPPALRYGTALLAKFPMLPVRAYHLYTAWFYCLGIVAVYLFVRLVRRSRGEAWLSAAAAALVSPSFLFMKNLRDDAWLLVPQRLGVLVRYGEGPHITAVALLPLALAAAWLAIEKRRPAALALAALFSALVVSHNFYGATALALLFPILVWSLWITRQEGGVWLRAAAVVGLSYGLVAFWFTPSYCWITMENLKVVAHEGNAWSIWVALGAVAAFLLLTRRWAKGKPEAAYAVFVWGAFAFLALNTLGDYWLEFRVIGESRRLVPELDLAMILLAALGLGKLWRGEIPSAPRWLTTRSWVPRAAAVVLAVAALSTAGRFVGNAWRIYAPDADYTRRIEYRLSDWMARNHPDYRTMTTGSVRFWYDTWHDLAQVSGGSEQGMLNPLGHRGQWQIRMGEDPQQSIVWLQALGADAIMVHDKNSQEWYKDIKHPKKFAGVLPVLYDSGEGDVIYRIPRKPGLARVVDRARVKALPPIGGATEAADLQAYVAAVENGPDVPAPSAWEGTDAVRIHAALKEGQGVSVMVSYDPYWRAYAAGKRLHIDKDVMGFLLIDAPPGEQDLRLVFELPLENIVGRVISALAALVALGLAAAGIRRRKEAPGKA